MAKQLPVIAAGSVLSVDMQDCEIEGWVWPQSAKRQEQAGKLAAILDSDNMVVGYLRVGGKPERIDWSQSKAAPMLERSSASITAKEVMLYAGRHFKGGRSRTAHLPMNSEKRLTREHPKTGRKLPAEDAVERVIAKVQAFGELRMVAG